MESYADDLWQNLLASGQAAEAKDPAELTWWAAGAIDVEAGHNLGNTLATKLLEVRDIGGRKHANRTARNVSGSDGNKQLQRNCSETRNHAINGISAHKSA